MIQYCVCVIDAISSFRNPDVQDILGGWNLEFEKSLLKFTGRTFPPEKINQKGGSVSVDHIHNVLVSSMTNHSTLKSLLRKIQPHSSTITIVIIDQ